MGTTGTIFLLGLVLSLLGVGANNLLAGKREENARQENYQLNEQAADNADARTRALYNDLQSPSALLSQYQEAGLSPSMMFGGTPGGNPGQGAMGAGAAGISPTTFGFEGMDASAIADIKLKNAEARKANAEADTEAGINDRGKSELTMLVKKINNQELQNELQEYENTYKLMQTDLFGEYGEAEALAKINELVEHANQMKEQAEKLKTEGEILKGQKNALIQKTNEEVKNTIADTMVKYAQVKLINKQVTLTKAQCLSLLGDISYKQGMLTLGKEKLQKQVEQWAIENGFKKKDQQIAIAKMVLDFYLGVGDNTAKFIDAIMPF